MRMEKIRFDGGKKFDLQLAQALVRERELGEIFAYRKIEKVELKTETWLWEQSGNICIEYASRGQPSGINATDADYWVHELRRGDETLLYLMFPVDRLRDLVAAARLKGRIRQGGDDGEQMMVLLPLAEILQ